MDPIRVAFGRTPVDMVAKAKFAKDNMEESPPLAVVGFSKIQDDGDMAFDVDELDLGGRWRVGGDA